MGASMLVDVLLGPDRGCRQGAIGICRGEQIGGIVDRIGSWSLRAASVAGGIGLPGGVFGEQGMVVGK